MRTWKKAVLSASMVALVGTHAPAPAFADTSSQTNTSASSESSSETGEKIGNGILGVAFVFFLIFVIGNADRWGSCGMNEDACRDV